MKGFLEKNNIGMINGKLKIKETTKNIMIDIGLGNTAHHSENWFNNVDNLQVIAFEPVPENINCIKNGIVKYATNNQIRPSLDKNRIKINDFILLPCALSNVKHHTTSQFYVTGTKSANEQSSLFQINPLGAINIKECIHVDVFSLKHFFDLFPWEQVPIINYIKIDAQGADLDIIKSAGAYLKERVVYVTAEPDGNYYKGADYNNAKNIFDYMISIGFKHIRHYNTRDPTFINTTFINKKDNIYINQYS